MRGAWIIFCFTLHNLYSWKTTNSFPRASHSPESNLPVSCRVYLHPHNLRHTLQKEPLTFVFWANIPQSNIEPIITKNPSFSGWKLSFEGKKMTEICSIIHKCTIHGEKNYINLDFSSPLICRQWPIGNLKLILISIIIDWPILGWIVPWSAKWPLPRLSNVYVILYPEIKMRSRLFS